MTLPQVHMAERRRLLEGQLLLNEAEAEAAADEREAVDVPGPAGPETRATRRERRRRKQGRKRRAAERFAELRGLA